MVCVKLQRCQTVFTRCLCCLRGWSCRFLPLWETQIWSKSLLLITNIINLTFSFIELWLSFCCPGAFHTLSDQTQLLQHLSALCSYLSTHPGVSYWALLSLLVNWLYVFTSHSFSLSYGCGSLTASPLSARLFINLTDITFPKVSEVNDPWLELCFQTKGMLLS